MDRPRVLSRIAHPEPGAPPPVGPWPVPGGTVLASLACFLAAVAVGTPGLRHRARAARLGLRIRGRPGLDPVHSDDLLFRAIDSVRHFELEFVGRAMERAPEGASYLDVSSPRLVPLGWLTSRPGSTATLVNPDAADLRATGAVLEALGLLDQARLLPATVEAAPVARGAFDLVTCVSVVEHIPAPGDARAVGALWDRVRPGGTLVLTVPCARTGFDEYIDVDPYGLLPAGADGWFFGQRFYDTRGLEECLFATCGVPARAEVFGEARAGYLVEDRLRKVHGAHRWETEPWRTGRNLRRFARIEDLPGWGVVGMEFRKPPP
jgi:hypothetical protein